MEQDLYCENVFDLLLHTRVLKLQNLREKVKTFYLDKSKFDEGKMAKPREKTDPNLFTFTLSSKCILFLKMKLLHGFN